MAGILLNSAVLAAYRKLWSEPAVLGLLAAILFCVATAHDDRRIILATVVASIAILFRFAMLATIPFLCVAFAVKGRRKVLTALPLLAPVPWWIATWLVGVPLGASRVSSGSVVNWEKSGIALAQLGDQLLPSRVFGAATLVLVAASIAYAVYRERSTAVVSAGWILAYAAFLLVAQRIASPSFDLDLRILLPMYLGCVVALGAGANAVAARSRVAAAVLVLPLLLVPLRGARQFLAPATPPNAACLGREAVVAQARALAPRGPIATNAEGLIWYATRQAVTPEGSTKIWVAADEACPGVIDRPSPMPPKALLIARSSSGPP